MTAPARVSGWRNRRGVPLIGAAVALVIGIRLAALPFLFRAPESDSLNYLAMARSAAAGGPMTDIWGQHVFYSAGYPLLVAIPTFVGLDALAAALTVNLLLAGVAALCLDRLTRALGGGVPARLIALILFAFWMPGIQHGAMAARENLSVPLLLALAWAAVAMLRGAAAPAAAAGALWSAAIIAGGSAIGVLAAPLLAILRGQRRILQAGMLAIGALAVLAPWLIATTQLTGSPVLNSSSGFNLYLGNNPAATGRFVSIADTPAGPGWEALRRREGEVGASGRLAEEARQWVADNPGAAARLAATKLLLFWAPNVPDARDFADSPVLGAARVGEVIQYVLLLVGGLAGLWLLAAGPRMLLGLLILGYWLPHAAAYIIPRYRDPVMPVLIVTCALLVHFILKNWMMRRLDLQGYC